jgi:peptide-methionine (R)-S-oxide reductase
MKLFKWSACLGVASVALIVANAQVIEYPGVANTSPVRKDKVVLSEQEWMKRLTDEQYKILRNKGTEPAFCGVNLDQKGEGTYFCVGCNLPLFQANHKFNSGTGWPSFFRPFSKENVWFHIDNAFGMQRTEVLCSKCDGHLGHVFNDGPKPSGLRFCINGKVLKFVTKKDLEKAAKAGSGKRG